MAGAVQAIPTVVQDVKMRLVFVLALHLLALLLCRHPPLKSLSMELAVVLQDRPALEVTSVLAVPSMDTVEAEISTAPGLANQHLVPAVPLPQNAPQLRVTFMQRLLQLRSALQIKSGRRSALLEVLALITPTLLSLVRLLHRLRHKLSHLS